MATIGVVEPLPYTLLSLPRYARIMGIPPAHFSGGVGDTIWPAKGNCSSVWPRYSWQNNDQVSHEDLARVIHDAEADIARFLGYWPAPRWIAREMAQYPKYHRPEYRGWVFNPRGENKSIKTRYGKFIQAGRRAVTLIATATVAGGTLVYSDQDADGFNETATVTATTSLTNACEVKVYHNGVGGAQDWEIRPERTKTVSGGTITFVFDSWLFLKPQTLGRYATSSGFQAIDLDDSGNYVTSVQVYREYTDSTQDQVEFYWEPDGLPSDVVLGICSSCNGSGCAACETTVQGGCLHVRHVDLGVVVPVPASYDSGSSTWESESFSVCRAPDQVKLWYYAGDVDEYFLRGDSCDPLSDYFAHTIAWLATARLERPFCSCGNLQALADELRREVSLSSPGGNFILTSEEALNNPFGTRVGEVRAWRRIARFGSRLMEAAVI